MKTLIIDNYDSFTYNLYQYVGSLGGDPVVVRNDSVTVAEVQKGDYRHIIISPGPGDPTDGKYFGICTGVILECGKTTPIFGVCLGHQGIITAFGGKIVRAPAIRHGKISSVSHTGKGVFRGLPSPLRSMRYHSLVGDAGSIPDCLEITAVSEDDGQIMGVRHRSYPIVGVQFHPESAGTEYGLEMVRNFLTM